MIVCRSEGGDADTMSIIDDNKSVGLLTKVLADLQRFLCCGFVHRSGSGGEGLSQELLKEMLTVIGKTSSCSARCNLLFRSNATLRTGVAKTTCG